MRVLFFIFMLIFTPLFAHKLTLFYTKHEDSLSIKSYFASGNPCKECEVTLLDRNGVVVYSTTSDENGEALIKNPPKNSTVISINGYAGHSARTELPTMEDSTPKKSIEESQKIDNKAVEEMLKTVVRKELEPLIKELQDREEEIKTDKIIASIGYILGLFGLFALIKYRR